MKGKIIMKTAINGKIRLKWFWGCMYSGRGMTPIEKIFTLGKLILAKVVYPTLSPSDQQFWKKGVLDGMQASGWFDIKWEPMLDDCDMWYVVYSTIDKGYVGTPEDAYRLVQRGLTQIQKADPKHNVCSIGFHKGEQKWYGWSHRARYGFGIGAVVEKGDCCASSGWTEDYLKEHPEEDKSLPVGFKAKTLKDARRMAVAFAESVS